MVVYYGTKLRKIASNTSKLFGEINVAIAFGSSQNGPKISQNSRNSPSLGGQMWYESIELFPWVVPPDHDATRFEVRGSQIKRSQLLRLHADKGRDKTEIIPNKNHYSSSIRGTVTFGINPQSQ